MRRKSVNKKNKKTRIERFLRTTLILSFFISPTSIVFSKATLAKINFDVELEKKNIEEQQKTNESITMAIDELASLTKVQEVAEAQGLSYNNDNIKTVVKEQ